MKHEMDLEEMVASQMSKLTFTYVDDINEARTRSWVNVESYKSYYSGFKICKIGRSYYIQVTDSAKKLQAMAYAKKLAENSIRHYLINDDRYQEDQEEIVAREKTNELLGPEYVEDMDAARAKSYETGVYGVYIEKPFSEMQFDSSAIFLSISNR